MSTEISTIWTEAETDAVVGAVESLLRGFGKPTEEEYVEDYLSLLRGIPARCCVEAVHAIRRIDEYPNPAKVYQQAKCRMNDLLNHLRNEHYRAEEAERQRVRDAMTPEEREREQAIIDACQADLRKLMGFDA